MMSTAAEASDQPRNSRSLPSNAVDATQMQDLPQCLPDVIREFDDH